MDKDGYPENHELNTKEAGSCYCWGELSVYPLNKKIGRAVSGGG